MWKNISYKVDRMCRNSVSLIAVLALLILPSLVHATSSEDYLREAQEYAKKGDINAAIIQLKNALQKDPKNIKARYFLGKNYLTRGDGASAEKELLRAERLGMARQQMVVPLGRAMLLQGHADEVLDKIVVEDKFPKDVRAEVYVLRANAQMMLKQNDSARASFAKAIELEPDSLNALAGQARLAILEQNIKTAQSLTEKLVNVHPESDAAWAIHGEVERLRGDMQSALKSFDKAVSLQAYNLPALLGSAAAKLALGDTDGAAKRIEAIQRISPNHPVANYLNATLLFEKKDIEGAEAALQQVLKVAPNHFPSLQLMAAIDFSKGRYEQAEQALARVVQAFPENIAALKLLAATHLRLKQPSEAIKVVEKGMAVAPKDAQLLALAGTAYLQNKQSAKGTEYLEKAAAMAPDAAGIRTQLALGRLATGKTSQAVKELEAAVDLGQNIVQADVLLVMVRLRSGEYEEALKQAQAFVKKTPANPLPYNLVGAAYVGLKKGKLAREQFQLALTKDSHFFPALMNLARLDESEGHVKSARKRYESILKLEANHIGALLSLARLAEAEGSSEEAARLLEKAWETNDGAIQPGVALVRYYNSKQQPLRAVSIARDLNVKHPDKPELLDLLGQSQMAAKDYQGAQDTFETLTKLVPKSPQAYFELSRANAQLKNISAAKGSLEKSLSLRADFLPAQLFLAQLELQQKQTRSALKIAKKIQQQRPKEAVGFRLHADVLMQQGKYSSAVKVYQQAYEKSATASLAVAIYGARKKADINNPQASLTSWLKSHPDDQKVRTVLASYYQERGDQKEAVKQYRQVIEKHPENVAVLNNLAWSLHTLGKPGAVEFAKRAYDLAVDNPSVIDTYGWLLVETGKVNRGLVLLRQAVSIAPHLAEIRYHYGVGLYKLDQNREASAELSRALDISKDFIGAKDARSILMKID